MRHLLNMFLPLLAWVCIAAVAAPARGASYGVQDDGRFFSPQAVSDAEQIIDQIHSAHKKDVRVVTFPTIPDDLKADYEAQGKARFYETWAQNIGKRDHVNGVVMLATKDPGHLQVDVGDKTKEKAFTDADRRELAAKVLSAFKAKNYDEGLLSGVRFIQTRMNQNLAAAGASGAQSGVPAVPPVYSRKSTGGFSVTSWICLGVGILAVVFIIMAIANRNRGGYGGGQGYGAPPPGGYPPGYGGGYQGGGGYGGGYGGGGGGGGFGRGILGGLLGGALGAWGYDKLSGRENTGYAAPPPPVGGTGPASDAPDTSYSGSGGDFDSSAPGPTGGDFGSSGGDFGGGGDSGGGGGDFGGGGDSGGGGGDF